MHDSAVCMYYIHVCTIIIICIRDLIIFHAVDPPTIIIQPMSMIMDVGSDVTFSVTATSEDNVLTYQWFKNGVIIDSATDSTFQIIGATGEDEGFYTVEVSNSLNLTTTSNDATLTISKWVNCHNYV